MDIILGKARRRWSAEDKRMIVAETFAPGAVILDVCRRHQISSGQVHTWRKQLRVALGFPLVSEPRVQFMPLATIGAPSPSPTPIAVAPMIEVGVGGAAHVWITGAAPADLVAIVLKTLARK